MKYKLGQKIFVVTGNKAEFMTYRHRLLKAVADSGEEYRINDVVYVASPAVFRGYSDVHGVFYGNWKLHPEIHFIIQQIVICNVGFKPSEQILPDAVRKFYMETQK